MPTPVNSLNRPSKNQFFKRLKLKRQFFLYQQTEVESRTQGSRPRTQKRNRGQGQGQISEDRPSQGQGQECSRSRIKESATSVFRKKGLQKSFSGDLQVIGVPRIFDWGRPKPLITCYDVTKIFPNRNFLWDKDIVGWKI